MSLLDDVSIVVTPNGYKAGELYAVVPVPTEGAEEVTSWTNNDFSSFVSSGSNITQMVSSGSGNNCYSLATITSGKLYKLKFTSSQAITCQIRVSANTSLTGATVVLSTLALGLNEIYFTTPSDYTHIGFYAPNAFTDTQISGFTLKEQTKADMDVTRATDATRVNESGLIEDVLANVPRIDYTGGGCPHILAEPQRTNLVTESEDFTTWSQVNITPTPNSTTSPSGESDGTKFLSTSSSSKIVTSFSAVSGTTYAFSVYCKNVDATLIELLTYDGVNVFSYDATSEVNTSTWTKISFTFTAANTATGQMQIARDLPNGESVYFWGAQLEEGSYATSYIPTSGSTVTRNQDIFTRDGIGSLINSTEGVLFLEVAALSDDGTNRYLSINDGTTSNYIYFRFVSTSNTVLMRTVVAGVTINTLQTAITDTTDFNKFAFKWKSGDYAFWINGVESLLDASATIFGADVLNTIEFSFPASGGGGFPSKVKQLQVYDTALTDVQLAALTS